MAGPFLISSLLLGFSGGGLEIMGRRGLIRVRGLVVKLPDVG